MKSMKHTKTRVKAINFRVWAVIVAKEIMKV